MGLTLRNVELGGAIVDVRISGGSVEFIGPNLPARPDDDEIEARGGAVIAGLRDHHLHVLAVAARLASVAVGPEDVAGPSAFERVLRAAALRGPVRAVGYHESVAGDLDRDVLDRIVADVPVRVEHRTGGLWVLNTQALQISGIESRTDSRVERDTFRRPTGRVWRGDEMLRGSTTPPRVTAVGEQLAKYGVTAITDATATNDAVTVARLRELPQRVRIMGPLDLAFEDDDFIECGEVKLVLDDEALPSFDDAIDSVRNAHTVGRGVAIHCVTLVQLRFAIEVLRSAGVRGDRIEHASVAPPDAIADLRALSLAVATQPSFVAVRGDDYLRDVEPRDVPALYPTRSLLTAGVPTMGSTDAPYGPLDPWAAMRAAVERTAGRGAVLGRNERVSAWAALGLFGGNRSLHPGSPADLLLLAAPLRDVLARLDAHDVVATMVAGEVVHDAR